MNRQWQGEELNPGEFTDRALRCAIDACSGSKWLSDRDFALACHAELQRRRRLDAAPGVPVFRSIRAAA